MQFCNYKKTGKYNRKQDAINTYEVCKGCEHCDQPQVISTFHSLYQDQVVKGTHSGHLSVNHCIKETSASGYCIELWTFNERRIMIKWAGAPTWGHIKSHDVNEIFFSRKIQTDVAPKNTKDREKSKC